MLTLGSGGACLVLALTLQAPSANAPREPVPVASPEPSEEFEQLREPDPWDGGRSAMEYHPPQQVTMEQTNGNGGGGHDIEEDERADLPPIPSSMEGMDVLPHPEEDLAVPLPPLASTAWAMHGEPEP